MDGLVNFGRLGGNTKTQGLQGYLLSSPAVRRAALLFPAAQICAVGQALSYLAHAWHIPTHHSV